MRESASIFRTLELPGGSVVPFTSVPGERVQILHGHVWLTEEGSPSDAFLAAGEEATLGGRGLAVIEALGPARIQLAADVQAPSTAARAAGALYRRVMDALRRWSRASEPARGAA